MNRELRKYQFGFWHNLKSSSVGQLIGIEGAAALIISPAAAFLCHKFLSVEERISLANDLLGTTTGILGVLFAAFAIVAALLSDSYSRFIQRSTGRIHGFYSPFIIVIGVAIGTIFSIISYKAFSKHLPTSWEIAFFGATTFLFSYTLLNVLALARNMFAHGVTRVLLLEIESPVEREE